MSKSNLLLQITNGLWLIEPSAISSFKPILKEVFERDVELLSRSAKSPALMIFNADGSIDLAPETSMGSTNGATGSVAIISINGVIMKYDNCGDAGTQSIGALVQKLDANPSICAIVFKMDSPGGSVAGTEDFAKIIANCKVPTIAYCDGLIASAAYWFASQCDEIYCSNETDQIGSIGTMCSFEDVRPQFEAEGVVFHEIYADASVDKNQDFLQARKKNYDLIKSRLNAINDVFIANVKNGRGDKLNAEETLTGKVFPSKDAIAVGLVDGMKSFDEVIIRATELSKEQSNNLQITKTTMKLKSTFTAIAAFLTAGFTGFKAEDNITEEHLEKINSELATLAEIKSAKETVETALVAANASVATITAERDNALAEFETFKKGNPGTANTLKPGADDLGEKKEGFQKTSVDDEREQIALKNAELKNAL